MAATAPKTSASGEEARAEAAPVDSGAPTSSLSLEVGSAVPEGSLVRDTDAELSVSVAVEVSVTMVVMEPTVSVAVSVEEAVEETVSDTVVVSSGSGSTPPERAIGPM